MSIDPTKFDDEMGLEWVYLNISSQLTDNSLTC